MQTPPAMKIYILCLFFYIVHFSSYRKSLHNTKKIETCPLYLSTRDRGYNNSPNDSDSVRGFIKINNKKVEVTKLQLLNLIESVQKSFSQKNLKDPKFLSDFKKLVNGVFQAEGHIGGGFTSLLSIFFRPMVYISQNASDYSINFFVLLWLILDKDQNLKYIISINNKSRYFHIRFQTRNWIFIIDKLIPYLSLVYGDKYKGLHKLIDIYYIINLNNPSNSLKAKLINLTYCLVDNSAKVTSKEEKLKAVLGENHNVLFKLENYKDNTKPLSLLFLSGFLLGDGNFTLRIRDYVTGIWFIPLIRLEQKFTEDNYYIFKNIVIFLDTLSVKANISYFTLNGVVIRITLTIEGKQAVGKLIKALEGYNSLFFWKEEQINLMKNSLVLSSVAARHWKDSQLALLRLIYIREDHKLEKSFEHWVTRLNEIYSKRENTNFYITMSKNQAWLVSLPVALKILPKAKYFFFKTYNNSQEEALRAAIAYKDEQLKKWLSSATQGI